uniref:Uncharacterized protein n=1 Tax=Arundo donax TaxID=35708 RepID=A0A0A9AJW8_ARUDO
MVAISNKEHLTVKLMNQKYIGILRGVMIYENANKSSLFL